MTNLELTLSRIDKQETTGISVIKSFFDQVLKNVPHQVVATYPGCRYDADVYSSDGKDVMVEIKDRSQKYHPDYYPDMMFNIDKIEYGMNSNTDRFCYIYICHYSETNEIFLLNIDKNGKLSPDNQSFFDGMPICGFGTPLAPNQKNEYGVYWRSGVMIKKTFADDLSNKVSRERLYIPRKLFKHYKFEKEYGRWVELN